MTVKIKWLIAIIAICMTNSNVYASPKYVDSNNGLRVRASPSLEAEILVVLPNNAEVEYIRSRGEWDFIQYEDIVGYMYSKHLTEEPQENDIDNMTYLGTYQITAYEETGYCCANGNYPTVGHTIACNSLPFGTVVHIDGVGYRTVEDRGGSYHVDNWIDLYMGDVSACYQWGVQYRDVWLVEYKD